MESSFYLRQRVEMRKNSQNYKKVSGSDEISFWRRGLIIFSFPGQEHVFNCLKNIGFSDECAKIWQYNIKHTKSECFSVCIWSWITDEDFCKPDGTINDCLQCDEDKSGPNFKYFSGRTRRNSGIPSAICRPPETVYNMTHCYWYGDLSY